MIVACPSCQQRYRHEFDAAYTVAPARCSGCDECFPLQRPKATYRLYSEFPAVAAPAVTDEEFAVEMPIGEEIPVDTVVHPEVPPQQAAPPELSASQSLVESLVALVPTASGAWMAYYFAGLLGRDPITGAALGGALGLLLGWACLLWITRQD